TRSIDRNYQEYVKSKIKCVDSTPIVKQTLKFYYLLSSYLPLLFSPRSLATFLLILSRSLSFLFPTEWNSKLCISRFQAPGPRITVPRSLRWAACGAVSVSSSTALLVRLFSPECEPQNMATYDKGKLR
ncbi:uncharacterized protein LOC125470395, partial [Pyrus x bretschneideri]|uniref:uncharacterized protein LOC125470395 n=1 Tax=Pyrus x bretschneideri TaxID=225117 RepID=UPI00203018D3